jgi:hypothetical protein
LFGFLRASGNPPGGIGIVAVFSTIGVVAYHAFKAGLGEDEEFKQFRVRCKSLIRIVHILMIFGLLWFALVPSRNTAITMYVATHATPNNITKLKDAGKEFKNVVKQDILDIIEAVEKVKLKGGADGQERG